MSPHGPDAATFERASAGELAPHKIDGTLAFMFETRLAFHVTEFGQRGGTLQSDYAECWQGLKRHTEG